MVAMIEYYGRKNPVTDSISRAVLTSAVSFFGGRCCVRFKLTRYSGVPPVRMASGGGVSRDSILPGYTPEQRNCESLLSLTRSQSFFLHHCTARLSLTGLLTYLTTCPALQSTFRTLRNPFLFRFYCPVPSCSLSPS